MVPGGELDIATPTEVGLIIARALEEQRVVRYERKKGVIQLDANGNGVTAPPVHVLDVPSQYDWSLERVAIGGGTLAANALVSIYENQAVDTDLLEVIQLGAAGKYSDSFSNCAYITANSILIIGVSGGPANGQVTFNLQIRLAKHGKGGVS